MENKLEIRNIPLHNYWDKEFECNEAQLFIDGAALGDILNSFEKVRKTIDYDCKLLEMTFSKGLEWEYCDDFMTWVLAKRTETVVPILLCDGDTDFSCITITVRMRFDEKYVYWDEVGLVRNELLGNDKEYGISYLDGYTEEDFEKYGVDNAFQIAGTPEWCEWVSENYREEMLCRMKNYYFPFIQDNSHLDILGRFDFKIKLSAYEKMLRFYADNEPKNIDNALIPENLYI